MSRSKFLTPFIPLALAAAFALGACDDEDSDTTGDTAAMTGSTGADTGCEGETAGGNDCPDYTSCVADMCEDCLDVCSDYISCAAGCGCGDAACQTDCLTGQSSECSTCFVTQGMCAGSMCSAELMACMPG